MASGSATTAPILLWQETHPEWYWLSQWYECPFHTGDRSIIFHTAEHYMMYHKAKLFSDDDVAAKILSHPPLHPKKVQALGRQVKNYDRNTWIQHRERIVESGNYHKFMHSLVEEEDLKARFLATGDREFIEASPYDKIWGVGFSEEDALENRERWGLNLLGKALTRARERIKEEHREQ